MSGINESVTSISNWTSAEFSKHKSPSVKFILVQVTDIDNIDYVDGCIGKPKIILEYKNYEGTELLTETTFFYRDSNFPKIPTEIKTK